jgi:predicted CoA-binding protein
MAQIRSSQIRSSDDELRALLKGVRRIAVLGMKTEEQADQPAFYVPRYLSEHGFEIVPVPVYYPTVKAILGLKVYRRLMDIPGEVDLVEVFRRPGDLLAHLEDVVAKRPRAVWLQSGISHPEFSARLVKEGIDVVESRCLMVEHRRLGTSH